MAATSVGKALCGERLSKASGSTPSMPAGCSIILQGSRADPRCAIFWNSAASPTAACGAAPAPPASGARVASGYLAALSTLELNVTLDEAAQTATITLSGPAYAWFGVGFNATSMGGGAPGEAIRGRTLSSSMASMAR